MELYIWGIQVAIAIVVLIFIYQKREEDEDYLGLKLFGYMDEYVNLPIVDLPLMMVENKIYYYNP